ncbi:MAG: sialidase [Gemmatimonadetes bacterium]|nr:sialidase [Gemmatimonadota bacterium]
MPSICPLLTRSCLLAASLWVAGVSWASEAHAQSASALGTDLFSALTYRHIGPVGNRVSAVTGVAGDPNVFYFGAASGGIFKTEDGGVHWTPIFDGQPAASIGSLAVAPSDPNVVWAGTGETFIRSNVSIGNGVYRSTDGGDSWTHMGLENTGRIGRVIIHPTDPNIVYVAALGHLYGPQQERGVYRTSDGGDTWERVLFVDENSGAVDLVMDPNNPRILFAATWEMLIRTWGRWSGGPGSGIHQSRDGGDTWERLEGNGLPSGTMGKIGLAMSPDDSDRIYALIETNSNREYEDLTEHEGVLWRSDDGGRRWRMVNGDHTLAQRPLYYTRAVVAPDNADEVHFLSTAHTKSRDAGESFSREGAGGDNHDMWIDPLLPGRMIVGHDGGVSISTNRGKSWMRPRLPIAQIYHAYTDTRIPYNVYGNRQDGPSQMGPSNSLSGGTIPIGAWQSVGGCESGFAVPDPVDPAIVWSGCYDGILDRYDHRTGHARRVSVWPDNPEGWPAAELRYRFQWTFPVAISPHDHNRVYVGSQHVHQTTDGGQSWQVISPDLTTNDESKQEKTGGLTPDDTSPTYAAVLFAIAESPLEEGVIWAGSNDGLVHVTRDGGLNWVNVTRNMPDLPEWGTVSNVEPSRHAPGTAYVTVDFHQIGNTDPYVYKTEDYGATWRSLAAGIPRSVFSYAHVVREDPVRPGLLYVGTENSIFVSLDDGESWSELQSNLPHAPAHWLDIQPHFNDLVVATYGRGFWIMDDLTPLQQLTDDVLASDVHLFDPRPAYRFLSKEGRQSQPDDPGAGRNPTYGASLTFYLREVPDDSVRLRILDDEGVERRSLSPGSLRAGLNRLHWNLREESSKTPRLRSEPVEHSHLEMPEQGWRALGEGGRVSPLAPPGIYTVELTMGDLRLTQPLEVLKDPTSEGTEEGSRAQVVMLREIRAAVDSVVALIDRIEWFRAELHFLSLRVQERGEPAEILEAAEEIETALVELEMLLADVRLTGGSARQDTLRWPRRLFAKLTSLAGYLDGTDHRPTDQSIEVFDMYQAQLSDYQALLESLTNREIANFNRLLRQHGVAPLTTQ